jgi:hypothetical protein
MAHGGVVKMAGGGAPNRYLDPRMAPTSLHLRDLPSLPELAQTVAPEQAALPPQVFGGVPEQASLAPQVFGGIPEQVSLPTQAFGGATPNDMAFQNANANAAFMRNSVQPSPNPLQPLPVAEPGVGFEASTPFAAPEPGVGFEASTPFAAPEPGTGFEAAPSLDSQQAFSALSQFGDYGAPQDFGGYGQQAGKGGGRPDGNEYGAPQDFGGYGRQAGKGG